MKNQSAASCEMEQPTKINPDESLDTALKAIIANCLLLELPKALAVYQGDPIRLVAELYKAIEILAGNDDKEVLDRYVCPF